MGLPRAATTAKIRRQNLILCNLQLFVTLGKLIGYHGVFFLYAAVSAASYVFVLCFVPGSVNQPNPATFGDFISFS